jgi:arylamine N-acetyltransferase
MIIDLDIQNSEMIALNKIESIILEQFQTVPFHNFNLLYGENFRKNNALLGGTCSDKTLIFIETAKKLGFEVYLHSALIGGKDIHRLARVVINQKVFFADVGNGWPSLKLYPCDQEVSYQFFGMIFKTKIIDGQKIQVFHEKNGKEYLQLEINIQGKPESVILSDIENRFKSDLTYPFSNSLRLSLIVDHQFLFLRGNQLEIYTDSSFTRIEEIDPQDMCKIIFNYFGYLLNFDPVLLTKII